MFFSNKPIFEMSLQKKCILCALVGFSIFTQNKLVAQSETEPKAEIFRAKNLLFAEFIFPSINYSVNYGRIFYQKEKLKISGGAGFTFLYQSANEPIHQGYWVPVYLAEISAFYGKSKHNLELGIGYYMSRQKSFSFDEDFPQNIKEESYWGKTIIPRIGYRYQKPEGGLFFRVGYTPTIGFESLDETAEKVNFIPFGAGISLGLSF
jgi:hypothetical protein